MTDAARKIAERVPLPEPEYPACKEILFAGDSAEPLYTAAQMEALRLAVAEEAFRGAEAVERELEIAMCALKYAYGNTSGRLHDAVSKAIDEIGAASGAPPVPAVDEAMVDAMLFSQAIDECGEHRAMLIDFMGMGSPEKLPLAREVAHAALTAALHGDKA